MPFKSEAQRKLLWAKHPDIAERWSKEYPHQKKLPEHVKKAFAAGIDEAFDIFGCKTGAEEIRLKIPTREFHGFDAAFERAATGAGKQTKKADEDSRPFAMEPSYLRSALEGAVAGGGIGSIHSILGALRKPGGWRVNDPDPAHFLLGALGGAGIGLARHAVQKHRQKKEAEDQDDQVTMPLPQQASADQPVEKLVEILQELPDPTGTNIRETNQNNPDTMSWSAPQSIAMNQTPSTGTTF